MSIYFNQKYWYKINFDLIWEQFPYTNFDVENCKWLHIPQFPLPENWLHTETNLLIILPGLKGDINHSKPDGFYINKGLKTKYGSTPQHIFEKHEFNDRFDENWARYSFHLKKWSPSPDGYSGDTLITLLEALTIGLFILADEKDNGVKYE